jgi:tRNA (cmo5U34)-methyltransferase
MDEVMYLTGGGPEGWGEEESEAFVEFGRAMVPGREEMERTFLDLLPAERRERFVGVEIGTGTGWLSAAVLRGFPESRMIGLDRSPRMLRKARDLLAPYLERVDLRPFRLEEPSWTDELSPVRAILSSLVLHHLSGPDKRELYVRLFEKLEPGGALLFADLMEARTERARRHFATAWAEEIRNRSVEIHGDARAHGFFERERWNIYDHPDPMDRPSTLPEQLHWLEEAGFEGVDVFWARAGHALLGGYRPTG